MTAPEGWTVRVPGRCPPKGSARSFAIRRGGAFTGATVTVQGNAASLAEWAARCALEARTMGVPLAAGPWRCSCSFAFERPKAHRRAGGALRPDAPVAPTGRPDLDKLLRTVLDALTGIAWADDSQVVLLDGCKMYADAAGTEIRLRPLGEGAP